MKDRCFDSEDLGKYLDLEPGDPDLEHLEHCTVCRSLMLAYRRFLDPGDLPEGARPDQARRELSRFLAEQIADSQENLPHISFSTRLWAALTGPLFKPGLALATLCLVLGIYWTGQDLWTGREGTYPPLPSGIVRELPAETAGTWKLSPPVSLEEEGVALSWEVLPDAESYRVELLDTSLIKIGSFDTAGAIRLELQAADFAALSGEPRFWRVLAFTGGDEVARSSTRSLSR